MAVSQPNKKDQKAEQKAPEAQPSKLSLELMAHNRYVYRQTVFEKGQPFQVPAEFGKELLGLKTDKGQPVFVRFEGDSVKTVEVVRELRTVEAPVTPAGAPAAPAAVELASPEELAELGLSDAPEQETVKGEAGTDGDQAEVTV